MNASMKKVTHSHSMTHCMDFTSQFTTILVYNNTCNNNNNNNNYNN